MSALNWQFLLLWVQVRAAKIHPGLFMAGAFLLLSAVVWTWIVPTRQLALLEKKQLLQAEMAALNKPAMRLPPNEPASDKHLKRFYAALGNAANLELPIKQTLSIARQANLQVMQSDYKFMCETGATVCSLRMQLPVTGAYASVRWMLLEILGRLPNASLDDVQLKRDDVVDDDINAQLQLTFFVSPEQLPPQLRAASAEKKVSP